MLGKRMARRSAVSLTRPRGNPTRNKGLASSAQRVVVQVRYRMHNARGAGGAAVRAGNLREHLRYIARDTATAEGDAPELFDGDGKVTRTGGEITSAWADDRHHYRLMIGPERGGDLGSLKDYTRSVMQQLEAERGGPLEWVAAVHTNTDHPHAHVVLRGRRGGKILRLDRATVTQGIRAIAQAEATRRLGPRTKDQIQDYYKAQVQRMGATEIDRHIVAKMSGGVVQLDVLRNTPGEIRHHLAGRLNTLATMGFAEAKKGGVWRVQGDLLTSLRDMERRSRAGADARRVLGHRAGGVRYHLGSGPSAPVVGTVAAVGLTSGGERSYVAVAGRGGIHWAETAPSFAPRVRVGGVVELTSTADSGRAVRGVLQRRGGQVTHDELKGDRHGPVIRRELDALVDAGKAARVGDGWRLAADAPVEPTTLPKQKDLIRIGVIAHAAPQARLRVPAWSALDRYVTRPGSAVWPGGAEEVSQRRRFLVASGYARETDAGELRWRRGAPAELRQRELRQHADQVAAAEGVAVSVAEGPLNTTGRVVAVRDSDQGPLVAIRRGRLVVLTAVQVRGLPAVGESVTLVRDRDDRRAMLSEGRASETERGG